MTKDEQQRLMFALNRYAFNQLFDLKQVKVGAERVAMAYQKAGKRPRTHIQKDSLGRDRAAWVVDAI